MKKMAFVLSVLGVMILLSGCGSKVASIGFLSDYSKLQKESDSSLRYVNEPEVAKYSGFIVDPVKVYLQPDSKSEGKLTEEQTMDLANYTHGKIVEAVEGAGKTVVNQPAAGVARIRVALTDIEKTSAVNMLPQASLLGAGIGGASMEAEVVDSVSGQQIGAVVESGKGSRVPFANMGDWTAAKSVINGWAERFQKRLQDAK